MRDVKDNKLLLHICCGPCAMAPVDLLLKAERDLALYFFNPNIHPEVEWKRRQENAEKAAAHYSLPIYTDPDYDLQSWLQRADAGKERCAYCYSRRLAKTAQFAAEHGFDSISTTLLVSPYQDREAIISIGDKLAKEYGLNFEAHDWRDVFYKGQDMARSLGLYRQKYCGCIVSLNSSKFYDKIMKDHAKLKAESK